MSETNTATGIVELVIGGMTCGSCAARIERKLNRLDGVTATVSYATERAYVSEAGGRDCAELIGVIETAGYTARLAGARAAADDPPSAPGPARSLRLRLAICVPLAAAVIALAMIPAAQFPGWQWLSLALAGPVAVWGGWPLHRAAWLGLGHGAATMDTLVSLGVATSVGWSLYALLFGGAGTLGMRMPFALAFGPVSGDTLYLEVAAGVTAAVLTGRYLEARAKSRSGAALAALASLGAKTVAVLRGGAEQRVPASDLAAGELFVVRPGEKIATDGVVSEGKPALHSAGLRHPAMSSPSPRGSTAPDHHHHQAGTRQFFGIRGLAVPLLASFAGALPIGMLKLSVLLFARLHGQSFAAAGIVTGAMSLGSGAGFVAQGACIDRRGQAMVLASAGSACVALLAALVVVVAHGGPGRRAGLRLRRVHPGHADRGALAVRHPRRPAVAGDRQGQRA